MPGINSGCEQCAGSLDGGQAGLAHGELSAIVEQDV